MQQPELTVLVLIKFIEILNDKNKLNAAVGNYGYFWPNVGNYCNLEDIDQKKLFDKNGCKNEKVYKTEFRLKDNFITLEWENNLSDREELIFTAIAGQIFNELKLEELERIEAYEILKTTLNCSARLNIPLGYEPSKEMHLAILSTLRNSISIIEQKGLMTKDLKEQLKQLGDNFKKNEQKFKLIQDVIDEMNITESVKKSIQQIEQNTEYSPEAIKRYFQTESAPIIRLKRLDDYVQGVVKFSINSIDQRMTGNSDKNNVELPILKECKRELARIKDEHKQQIDKSDSLKECAKIHEAFKRKIIEQMKVADQKLSKSIDNEWWNDTYKKFRVGLGCCVVPVIGWTIGAVLVSQGWFGKPSDASRNLKAAQKTTQTIINNWEKQQPLMIMQA